MSFTFRKFPLFLLFVFIAIIIAGPRIAAQNVISAPGGEGGTVVIGKVVISGNKITRPRIILRELRFKEGDTISASSLPSLLKTSRDNVFNTSLFNFVTLDTLRDPPGSKKLDVNIHVIERWYIWPWPIFEISDRNFNAWLETTDFSRLTYGVDLTFFNMRGRNETLKFPLHFGYNQRYGLDYEIPYINRKQTIGISFGGEYAANHELVVETVKNKPVYFKDPKEYPKALLSGFLEMDLRPNFYAHHSFVVSYNQYHFSEFLLDSVKDFSKGIRNVISYFSFYYQYKNDHRDIKFYPLKGLYFDAEFDQNGFFGDPVSETYVKTNFRKYWQLARKWYFASGLTVKITLSKDPPYFMQRGLGYGREFVRGYEYYIIDGRNFLMLKNNLKFAIIPQRVAVLKFLKTKKFNTIPFALYMNVLLDGGYVYNDVVHPEKQNDLQNSLLVGYGVGFDLTTYYDIVIRTELTMNGRGEPGVYLHFMAPF